MPYNHMYILPQFEYDYKLLSSNKFDRYNAAVKIQRFWRKRRNKNFAKNIQ